MAGQMRIAEAQQRTEAFLTAQMPEALHAVDYALPPFDAAPAPVDLAAAARARVEVRHVRGASDAVYRVHAFEDTLLMQLQLNVWRFVAIYRVPARQALDAARLQIQLERWRLGAEHAGWTIGWRDAVTPGNPAERWVETYAYARTEPDLLASDLQQLYWRTDIAQMTRSFMLEALRCGIRLTPSE